MTTYAKGTPVPVEKTRVELDKLLKRHGATSLMIGQDDEKHLALIGFALGGARFRLALPLPWAKAEKHWKPSAKALAQRDQRTRERWRLVLLLVKAKLEAIRLNLSTATREFMPDMVVDNGQTMEEVLAGGGMMKLLGPASNKITTKENSP